ncbi:M20/M25/M40 family metallo-hydrolase [Salinirubellus salinus]|uniref:M20/M25/M40 family metallo-hydrolase n=2 Tax=Salinirubellus salinus TaxID=1364945 RepID=A0A9E7R2L5_9EURY|nr:M20/M25/M40 family metallo-hydrolase [Salinirubellus salinus]UWM54621.1 M20/M25/M40 family metallo-hydrolase [Salinirubellus salinus]
MEPPTDRLSAERVADLALDLLAVDTQNPPGDVRALADHVESFLADLGLDTDRVAVDPAKPNVLATVPGEADRTLLYNGHLDTVPFDAAEWTHDPLGERDGDRVYGRGATDMKGPLAAMLHTAETFVAADADPPVDLTFAFVSDEETGGSAGVRAILDQGAVDADACVVGETTCSGGNHSVTVADRGSIWLTLRAEGEAAHGSRPMLGANAIDRLWAAVSAIRERLPARPLPGPEAMAPIVEESVAYYGPTMGADAARELFSSPTVNLGTIEGGESVNTVPAAATARLDVRLNAGVETPTVLADIRECLREYPHVAIEDASWSVGTYEPLDSPLVESVASTAEAVTEGRVYRRSATGGGDAKKFREAGVPTVEFALGTDTVHAVDEYTTLRALVGNAEVYTRLPAVWATATA